MKKTIIAISVCTLAAVSCNKIALEVQDDHNVEPEYITSSVTLTSELTKSTIDEHLAVAWEKGDKLYYYTDVFDKGDGTYGSSDKRNVSFGETSTVSLKRLSGDTFYAVLFPGEDGKTSNAVQDYNLSQFGYSGINPDQTGTFAFANISVGYVDGITDDTENINLTMKNITSILKFTLSGNDVTSVTLKSNDKTNGNQINGRINVDITAAKTGNPSASFRSNYPGGSGRLYESVINFAEPAAGTYYFAVMPTTLTNGFTLELKSAAIDGAIFTTWTASKKGSFTFDAGRIKNVGILDEKANFTTTFTTNEIIVDKGWSEEAAGTRHNVLSVDDFITITAEECEGANQNGYIYGTTTHDWRLYQARGNGQFSITAPQGVSIKSVKTTYNISNTGILVYGSDNSIEANQIPSGTVKTFDDKSWTRVFTVGNTGGKTNGQARITAWEIVCEKMPSE